MIVTPRCLAPLFAVVLVAGCSSGDAPAPSGSGAARDVAEALATPSVEPTAKPSMPPAQPGTPEGTLKLEGLGDLVIGKPVPAGSSFAIRGAQIPGSTCKTYSSPAYPGVYALIENGDVRRISVVGPSKIQLVEGIGVGSSEGEVLKAFPGFVSSPHQYVAAPAKYLTQPGSDPRLRFEIDESRKVSIVHVGVQPQLSYVEGCA